MGGALQRGNKPTYKGLKLGVSVGSQMWKSRNKPTYKGLKPLTPSLKTPRFLGNKPTYKGLKLGLAAATARGVAA